LLRFGLSARWLVTTPLLAVLVLVAVLDVAAKIIPDRLTLPGLAWALGVAATLGRPDLRAAVLGALVAGGVVLLVALVRLGAVGGGDVKLMAMLGAALGWKPALVALALSQLVAAAIVLSVAAVRWRRPAREFPIGAILALLGAVAVAVGV
jgi:leader peptidase (prepilin peptidase) / N-methyltransferase